MDEWLAWRAHTVAEVREEREALGLPLDPIEGLIEKSDESEDQVIEEIVEEVLEETEEIVS